MKHFEFDLPERMDDVADFSELDQPQEFIDQWFDGLTATLDRQRDALNSILKDKHNRDDIRMIREGLDNLNTKTGGEIPAVTAAVHLLTKMLYIADGPDDAKRKRDRVYTMLRLGKSAKAVERRDLYLYALVDYYTAPESPNPRTVDFLASSKESPLRILGIPEKAIRKAKGKYDCDPVLLTDPYELPPQIEKLLPSVTSDKERDLLAGLRYWQSQIG